MSEFSRRDFLRAGLGVAGGIALGATGQPVAIETQNKVHEWTGEAPGNAGVSEAIKDTYGEVNAETMRKYAVANERSITLTGPVIEEIIFRAVPSHWIDAHTNKKAEKSDPFKLDIDKDMPMKNVLLGHGVATPTAQEVGMGILTATAFAYMHNITAKNIDGKRLETGFDSRTVPVAQFGIGLVFSGLQRVFGVGSNTAAHIAFNTAGVRVMKR
jgi:hypothetical protein